MTSSAGRRAARKSDGDEEFARATTDMIKDTEIGTRVKVEMRLTQSYQRGVLRVESVARSSIEGENERQIAKTITHYPNERAGSLVAHLFACANTIAQMCESVRQEEWRARMEAPHKG